MRPDVQGMRANLSHTGMASDWRSSGPNIPFVDSEQLSHRLKFAGSGVPPREGVLSRAENSKTTSLRKAFQGHKGTSCVGCLYEHIAIEPHCRF